MHKHKCFICGKIFNCTRKKIQLAVLLYNQNNVAQSDSNILLPYKVTMQKTLFINWILFSVIRGVHHEDRYSNSSVSSMRLLTKSEQYSSSYQLPIMDSLADYNKLIKPKILYKK